MQYTIFWLQYLSQVKRLQAHSVTEYCKELERFEDWLPTQQTLEEDVTLAVLTQYVANRGRGLKSSTVNLITTALKSYFGFCYSQGYRRDNPAKFLSSPRREYEFRTAVAPEAIEQARQYKPLTFEGTRAQALSFLILRAGLRLSECLHLRRQDIVKAEHALIVKGKGGKTRKVYYDDVAATFLNTYVVHPSYSRPQDGLIFDYVTERQAREEVATLFRSFTQQRVNPHQLRHTFALNMLEQGLQVNDLMQLLGHDNLETTAIYLRTSQPHLRSNYQRVVGC